MGNLVFDLDDILTNIGNGWRSKRDASREAQWDEDGQDENKSVHNGSLLL